MFIYLTSSNSSLLLLSSINSGILVEFISIKYIISQMYYEKNYFNWLPGRGIVQADSGSVCSEIFG